MDSKKKPTGISAICGFSLTVGLACPILLAQTQDAKPASPQVELAIPKCDSSLMNPVPGESIADAARRIRAWDDCTAKARAMELCREGCTKKADLNNGAVKVVATADVSIPDLLIERAKVYVRNTTPTKQAYTLTVTCGKWSKTVSGTVDAADASPASQAFEKPAFTLDVSPPCKLVWNDLELSWPDEIKGNPEQKFGSVVPGVSDEEMAERLRAIQSSSKGVSRASIWDKVDKACKQRSASELANTTPSQLGEDMKACVKAYDEAEAEMKVQREAQQAARAEAQSQPAVSPGTLLVALSCHGQYTPGGISLEGEVQNVSSSPLHSVRAVVSWYTTDGQFIKSLGGPVQFDPILPNQVSPFEVAGPGNPAMTRYRLQFQTYGGETLPSEVRCSSQ
jgi:hypothetical protein